MPLDRFMIAPLNAGLQTNVKPWLIPDDAFQELQNAYVFRGRVKKRFGSYLMNRSVHPLIAQQYSRLRVQVGTTNGAGALAGTVPGALFQVGQMFSIGNDMYTVVTPGNNPMLDTTGTTVTKTFNTANGAFVFAGASINTAVWFYPALPVMGLFNYINDNDVETLIGFDTQFAYLWTGAFWQRIVAGSSVWQGTDYQFFWADNFTGVTNNLTYMFVTNYDATDPNHMRYYDGTTWFNFAPVWDNNNALNIVTNARMIISFKDRLLLLSTVENNAAIGNGLFYRNRIRYSAKGNALGVSSFFEEPDQRGYGGVIDNFGTQEAIVSAEFIKDRLIIFFEESTWELVYTGNAITPFVFQKINAELGSDSTFSSIPFDRVILNVGNTGINACNGSNVERIDDKVPDKVFNIHRVEENVDRVYGIRDFYNEMAYWTFPTAGTLNKFPTQVMVFNYKTQSWAFNDDSFTVFGYYFEQSDATWVATPFPWMVMNSQWDSGSFISQFRHIIAGNQQGFVFVIDDEFSYNAPSLQITNITGIGGVLTITSIDHNLLANSWIQIDSVTGVDDINDSIYQVDVVIDKDNFTIIDPIATGVYLGGGTIRRVSQINILSKQYNFYLNQGRNATISKIDFFVDSEPSGQVSVDYFASSNPLALATQVLELSPYALYPFENVMERLWHPIYPNLEGESVQIRIYLSDGQMSIPKIVFSDFELHAITFYASATSDRLQ